jgi:hypothetical protein
VIVDGDNAERSSRPRVEVRRTLIMLKATPARSSALRDLTFAKGMKIDDENHEI